MCKHHRVFASTQNDFDIRTSVASSHRCCAERTLIERYKMDAIRHGVRMHDVHRWLKRKIKHIYVFRYDSEGGFRVSFPCHLCRQELIKYGIKVTCFDQDGSPVSFHPTSSPRPNDVCLTIPNHSIMLQLVTGLKQC